MFAATLTIGMCLKKRVQEKGNSVDLITHKTLNQEDEEGNLVIVICIIAHRTTECYFPFKAVSPCCRFFVLYKCNRRCLTICRRRQKIYWDYFAEILLAWRCCSRSDFHLLNITGQFFWLMWTCVCWRRKQIYFCGHWMSWQEVLTLFSTGSQSRVTGTWRDDSVCCLL